VGYIQKVKLLAALRKIVASSEIWYHLTDRAKFKLDPKFAPADNAFAIEDRSGRPGIYLAPDIERWVNGKGYWRPFVVEFHVDPSVLNAPGVHGRWGGEMFVLASLFDKITIQRVIPLDAYCREKFGDYGWMESAIGKEFDTGNPIKEHESGTPYKDPFSNGYKYNGKDVRDMSLTETQELKRQLRLGVKLKRKYS